MNEQKNGNDTQANEQAEDTQHNPQGMEQMMGGCGCCSQFMEKMMATSGCCGTDTRNETDNNQE